MKTRAGGLAHVLLLSIVFSHLAAGPSVAAENRTSFRVGISFEHFSRTITWDAKTGTSKASANLFAARAEVEPRPGLVFDLEAGFSLSNFNGLHFNQLPITIDYEAGAVAGLLLGAGVRDGLLRFGDFEIEGVGRFVYSLGSTKTWPLEGFTVPGTSKGGPTWMRASAGPRISYLFFGKFVPYLDVTAGWFSGKFKLDETLGDLGGQETKKLRGKSLVEISLGADYQVSGRIGLKAVAGFLPYAGGVDGTVSVGFLFFF
jgi:hypothetical protein